MFKSCITLSLIDYIMKLSKCDYITLRLSLI